MKEFSYIIYLIINYSLLLYLGFTTIYILVYSIASKLGKKSVLVDAHGIDKCSVAVLIPAYKEDDVIIETASKAIEHESSFANIDVVVIADQLKKETIQKLKNIGVIVNEVSFTKSTKAKSLNYALNKLMPVNYVVVLDADNIMKEHFVDNILVEVNKGYKVVQGHRTAKNNNTYIAVLDGLSEEINNTIFRKGHSNMGLSASLIGSGFICETETFKNIMKRSNAIGGFDKEIELMFTKERITIGYAEDAIIYDEKIQQSEDFVNQRRRWLSAQFIYFFKSINDAIKHFLKTGSFDYLDKTLQFILAPRILTIGIQFIMIIVCLMLGYLLDDRIYGDATIWGISLSLTFISLLISIPKKMMNHTLVRSITKIPLGFTLMLKALFSIKGANKQFIHTKHGLK